MPERLWELLLDLERVAPCLPGGEVTERVDDRNYKAVVKVKLGPVQLSYRGEVAIVEADEEAWRTVMRAKASEARGQGTARATITTTLVPEDGRTSAQVVTELQLTGRVAQMGRGIVEDVSSRLMADFAACLSERVTATVAPAGGEEAAARPASAAPPVRGLGLLLSLLRARLARLARRGE